jgi:hypothetical protein
MLQTKQTTIRVFIIEIISSLPGSNFPIKRFFVNDYDAFGKAIKEYYANEKFKIDFIGYYEVEEKTLLNTYNAIINATIIENLLPETLINETINFLFLFYKRCNLLSKLNLYAPDGRFLWGDK